MKLNRIKTILSSVILGGLMVSCGPDKVGPELKGASSSFNKNVSFSFNHVTTNLGAEVMETELAEKIDFGANEEGFFTSTKFNEKVSWTITASGYGSGAVAQFSGTSDKINYDNSLWLYGRSSNVFFFQKKEFVKFELDIVGLDTTYTVDSVSVGRVRYWHKKDINGVGYVIIDAFDDDLPTLGLSATGPDNNDLDVKISVTDLNKVEGSSSLYLTGTDLNNNGWVGGRNHERLLELHEGLVIDSGIDEDELFFNIFIHGDSKIGNTTIEIKSYENEDTIFKTRAELKDYADSDGSLTSTQQSMSDGWIYDIIVNWDGWKMVSIPYSKFRASNDPNTGAGGNRVKESGKICAVSVNLLSYPTSGNEVSTYVDFMTITMGGRPQFKLK
ncbi:MAG: hypothetical protein ACI9U0_001300 [Flavobacteriales bacterium]|jgi:hypothetical protein